MAIQVTPIRRNLKFSLPKDKVNRWNKGHLHISQFFNTLSIFFPAGERFFIDSLRHYRDQITDTTLKEQVSAFIGQEAFHTREHEEYNEAMREAGIPVDRMEQIVIEVLDRVRLLPPSLQLAATISLEHLTALMGHALLDNLGALGEADPHFKTLWQWHALEETEHKAVAYDAFNQVVGTGAKAYAQRLFAFTLANIIFWSLFYPFYYQAVKSTGGHRDLKGWLESFKFFFVNPGPLTRIIPEWLSFLKPGFHPWQHDNRHLLKELETFAEKVEALHLKATA